MVVSIRLPSESNIPHHYAYNSRRLNPTFLSPPRLWRRVLPLALLLIICVETYRFFTVSFTPVSLSSISALDTTYDLPSPPETSIVLKTLVIIACHSIWLGGTSLGASATEWTLEPYQDPMLAPASFLAHITAGIEVAQSDPLALLIFSGGETRSSAGPLSEAGSYYTLATQRGLIPDGLRNRTTTEVAATDSYQNLLFSLCRFREVTGGTYPEKIVVISFEFKRQRFMELHRAAIGWPTGGDRFEYVGCGDPTGGTELMRAIQGEHRTRVLWEKDMYGCEAQGLRGKRRRRNWGRRTAGYELSCPELGGLFKICDFQEGHEAALASTPWSERAVATNIDKRS